MSRRAFVMTVVISCAAACSDATDPETGGEGTHASQPTDGEETRRETGGGDGPVGSWENDDVVSDQTANSSSGEGGGGAGGEAPRGDGSSAGGDEDGRGDPADGSGGMVEGCTSVPYKGSHCVCGDFRVEMVSGTHSPLGVTGDFTVETPEARTIAFPLTVAGAGGIAMNGDVVFKRDLRTNGPLFGAGAVEVAGDADVAGDVSGTDIRIGGTLTQPPGSTVNATGDEDIGQRVQGQVSIADPCDCDNVVDIAGTIAQHQSQNDNAAAGVAADAIQNTPADPAGVDYAMRELDLPAGKYYFDGADLGTDALVITAGGDVEIYVDGDLRASTLKVRRHTGKRLQLWVRGDFVLGTDSLESYVTFDALSGPGGGPFDLYVGGTSLRIDYLIHRHMSVTAPNATIRGADTLYTHRGRVLAAEVDYDGWVQFGNVDTCQR